MSQHQLPPDPNAAAAAVTPSEADQVRCSPDRVQRLSDYIQGILPPHLNTKVDVVVTPFVQTAAVLPATADALLDADETDLPPEQARQLVEQIDGEYLVLVTAQPASTDCIPVNDQLTADRAHQFGLAFHETLHILKTAISGVASLLHEAVDEEYQDLVHDLFNSIEDGAIESEAIEGDNFSDNAAVRLGITRRIHSHTPDDIDSDDPQEFTFWDAVTAALYEYAIYPTGIVDALTNPDDSRLVFTSEADRKAFEAVDAELERLAEEALQIRSSERDDVSHTHDKAASIKRAKRVLETWETVLKPVIDDEARDQQRQQPPSPPQPSPGDSGEQRDEGSSPQPAKAGDQTQSQASESEQAADAESSTTACPECDKDFESDHGLRTHYGKQHGDTEDLDDARNEQADDAGDTEGESDGDPSTTDAGTPDTDSDSGDDVGEGTGTLVPADNPEAADGVVHPAALDVDPEAITTDREATADPFQDVLDHPTVDEQADPDPHDVDLDPTDYQPEPDDGGTADAGEPASPAPPEPGPSHGGASDEIEEGETRSTAPHGSRSSAPDESTRSDTGSERTADSASRPAGEEGPAGDDADRESPAHGRDAGEIDAGGDTPPSGQSGASGGAAEPATSSPSGESEPGADGDEANTAPADGPADAAGEPESADGLGDADVQDTTRSSEARDLASHTDSGEAPDDDGQLSLGDFTSDSPSGGAPERSSDQARSGSKADTAASDTATGEDVPAGDDSARAGDTSGAGGEPAGAGAPSGAPSDGAPEPGASDRQTADPPTDAAESSSQSAGGETDGELTEELKGAEAGDSSGADSPGTPADLTPSSAPESPSSEGTDQEAAPRPGGDSADTAAPADGTGHDESAVSDEAPPAEESREGAAPAHGAGDQDSDLDLEALETDRKRARDTAARNTIDDAALADELAALDKLLDDEAEEGEPAGKPRGGRAPGGGAGPGSLDELTVLPHGDERVPAHEWEQIATNADEVADTLAKELSLDRQSAVRRGRTSGTYDTKTGYRLAYGDPRAFSSDLPGDEKRYALVLILDRSGSMGNGDPPKIRAATTAVARFALAAEQLDIDVAVIDFYRNEARLVKPFSVAVEHAQGALLAQEAGGGTPLSDALALGRTLVESQPTEPLLVTITDDMPHSVDAVEAEIRQTYAPVCSLTIATDCRRGNPPTRAKRLERVYDRTATVFDAAMLDDRLDQFASLLAGY